MDFLGAVAQWSERKPYKFEVDGSIPSRPTVNQFFHNSQKGKQIPRSIKRKAPQKICSKCGTKNHTRRLTCFKCLTEFKKNQVNLGQTTNIEENEYDSKTYYNKIIFHVTKLGELTGSANESVKMIRLVNGVVNSIVQEVRKTKSNNQNNEHVQLLLTSMIDENEKNKKR